MRGFFFFFYLRNETAHEKMKPRMQKSDEEMLALLVWIQLEVFNIHNGRILRRFETMFQENRNWLYDHLNRYIMLD